MQNVFVENIDSTENIYIEESTSVQYTIVVEDADEDDIIAELPSTSPSSVVVEYTPGIEYEIVIEHAIQSVEELGLPAPGGDGYILAGDLDGTLYWVEQYSHPNLAPVNLNANTGQVIDEITSNSSGHLTNATLRYLAAADIPNLAISKITGLQTELDNRYTETELQTSGLAQVHWDNLTNIPEITVYTGASLNVATSDGYTGDVNSLDAYNDSNILQVEEATGNPGFDIRVTFNSVTSFNNILIYQYYHGGANHSVHIEIYNPSTTNWDDVYEFTDEGAFRLLNIPVLNGSSYIDSGVVIIRIHHDDVGIATHYIEVDYLVLRDTLSVYGGIGVTYHSGLTGLNSDDHSQYALLSGRSGDILLIDTINEFTSDAGVTIEGVLLKDGFIDWGYISNTPTTEVGYGITDGFTSWDLDYDDLINKPTLLTSPLTTKGDIWGYSTVNDRLPVGTDGYVLSSDSTESTGLKWIAASGGMSDLIDDTSPQLGGDLDLNGFNIDFPTTANISDCLDEDNMISNSTTALATQQSIKAYSDLAVKVARAEILYTNTVQTTIVTLPVNAVIWDIAIEVVTIFNDSGTDYLDIGITGSSTYFGSGIGLESLLFDSISVSGDIGVTGIPYKSSGTNITFQYTGQNGNASQGQAFIYIFYSLH